MEVENALSAPGTSAAFVVKSTTTSSGEQMAIHITRWSLTQFLKPDARMSRAERVMMLV
jgi:peroxiredoxin family protein